MLISEHIQPFGDNFIPVIPTEETEDTRHILSNPFCFEDPTCPCHQDPQLIHTVNEQVQQGLLTPSEATRTVKGEML